MIIGDYTQDALYSFYDTKISKFLKIDKREEAQRAAFEWLQEYVNSLRISVPWNWKIAKKQIAAHFFGKQQSIQLQFDDDINPMLTKHLQQLITKHEEYLSIKAQCICYYLGIPQISIEGYFDTNSPSTSPMVVDIDLPFDRAFF